jgi:hypothetical protein
LILSGEVTLKLFFSTTNLAIDDGVNESKRNPRNKPREEELGIFMFFCSSATGFFDSRNGLVSEFNSVKEKE